MLSYLAAALPADTGAAGRLIALQCALRMDDSAQVRLPFGVLRSLRLVPATDPWQQLEQAQWLRTILHKSRSSDRVVVVHLLDTGLFTQYPAPPQESIADLPKQSDWHVSAAWHPLRYPTSSTS
ncbi:hypothetical protein [Streptomyces sp. RTd22]|uniref:hypothetical protein n=1 Tax=Streptomyces sp. RTd22 TaxID=1841249 RepID=UPI0007C46D98|nr:hypothetical protein [Streptomyces sp. RTd22]